MSPFANSNSLIVSTTDPNFISEIKSKAIPANTFLTLNFLVATNPKEQNRRGSAMGRTLNKQDSIIDQNTTENIVGSNFL